MNQGTRDQGRKPLDAGTPASTRAYEPPRIEKLGSLRDLLAAKSGLGNDPSPRFEFKV